MLLRSAGSVGPPHRAAGLTVAAHFIDMIITSSDNRAVNKTETVQYLVRVCWPGGGGASASDPIITTARY